MIVLLFKTAFHHHQTVLICFTNFLKRKSYAKAFLWYDSFHPFRDFFVQLGIYLCKVTLVTFQIPFLFSQHSHTLSLFHLFLLFKSFAPSSWMKPNPVVLDEDEEDSSLWYLWKVIQPPWQLGEAQGCTSFQTSLLLRCLPKGIFTQVLFEGARSVTHWGETLRLWDLQLRICTWWPLDAASS